MIRVGLADDQTLFRKGLARIIAAADDMELVGEAADGREAMEMYARVQPGVLVLDIVMPRKDGIDVTKELRAVHEQARILVLSVHDDLDHATRVLRAGATGFLAKTTTPETFLAAVRSVAAGERYLPPGIAGALAEAYLGPGAEGGVERLTDREFQVMRLIASGSRSREIAAALFISQKTVDTHRAKVLKKLGLATNADITRYAVRHGYIVA